MGNSFSVPRFGELAAIDFGIQVAGWAVSSTLQTEKFYDVTGSLTYWAMILRSLLVSSRINGGSQSSEGSSSGGASTRQKVCAAMVLAWSLRLGTFLARRAHKYGDSRFEKVKTKPGLFLVYWLVQGLWCMLTPLPVYMLLNQERRDATPLQLADYLSWGGWLVGFTMESVADMQKSAWRDSGNKGFMRSGLFRYSQHPNYFGEMLLWSSLCVSAMTGLEGMASKAASVASPLFVMYLLRFVSGVPLLQKAAMKKYGSDPQYKHYRRRHFWSLLR
eukprot:TRINITY_DN26211_c0_g1_i2.p1 TRINITY_DN26211_c0_g1~~TRINITY_DN26211_c0_g1_i2.p1  ORF type:complete len:275 (+),score=48.60 TRINITY_DN26211_c0_g1_i2:114-938(+)